MWLDPAIQVFVCMRQLADELINPEKMTYTMLGPVDDQRKQIESILPD